MTAEALIFSKMVAEDLDVGRGSATTPLPTGGDAVTTQINETSLGIRYYATWDPASCAALGTVTTSITIPGARVGDRVEVVHTALLDNSTVEDKIRLSARVIADDSVRVVLHNLDASTAFNLGTGTLRVCVFPWPAAQ